LLNFGFLHSLTLGELISKRFIAEEDIREWQGICTPKNLNTIEVKLSINTFFIYKNKKWGGIILMRANLLILSTYSLRNVPKFLDSISPTV